MRKRHGSVPPAPKAHASISTVVESADTDATAPPASAQPHRPAAGRRVKKNRR